MEKKQDLPGLTASQSNGRPSAYDPVAAYHPRARREDLLEIYRLMVLSRKMDEAEINLLKRGRTGWTASCAGGEPASVVAGFLLRKTDPIFTSYRDRGVIVARGVTPYEMFLEALSSRKDPASGGRQMSCHWGHKDLAILPGATPTGSQALPAQGLAEAIEKTRRVLGRGTYPADSVVYCGLGDATISQGEVYEAIKSACLVRSPILFHVINNEYGISTHVSEQHPNGEIVGLFRGWPQLKVVDIDGTSVRECLDGWHEGIEYARRTRRPVLVHSRTLRLFSHSSSDDQRKYRVEKDLAMERERDPLPRYAQELLAYGLATEEELEELDRQAAALIQEGLEKAEAEPPIDLDLLPSGSYRYRPETAAVEYQARVAGKRSPYAGRQLPLSDALNACLDELLALDPRLVCWGEDIADMAATLLPTHKERIEGKGGVFGVTKGLQKKYGSDRVFNSPLAEATIIGKAVGYAQQGFRPVVEIQFRDFLSPGWQQLVDMAGTMAFRSGGNYGCPIVVRMASGGYLLGAGGPWHSEMAAGSLLHMPGLRVAVPSDGRNGPALLRAAVYCGDPVVMLEPKALYKRRGPLFDAEYPDFDHVAWPGTSETYGEGRDLAFLTYGNTVPMCKEAARVLESQGIRSRILNLLWLNPLDREAIRRAAEECGRVLVVEEDRETCGAGMAILNVILKDRALRRRCDFDRVCARDCRVPFGSLGEAHVLPQLKDVLDAAIRLAKG